MEEDVFSPVNVMMIVNCEYVVASTEQPILVMSSDLTMYTGSVFNSAATASDDLTYDEIFPPLPTSGSVGNGADTVLPASPTSSGRNQWGKKMSLRSSTTTQVFEAVLLLLWRAHCLTVYTVQLFGQLLCVDRALEVFCIIAPCTSMFS